MNSRWMHGLKVALITAASVAVALVARLMSDSLLGDFAPFMFFAGAVAVSANVGGFFAGCVATLGGVVLGNLFFTNPPGSLAIASWGEALHEGAFMATGLLISVLSELRLRAVAQSEAHVRQLQSLASQLTLAEQRERRDLAQGLHDHLQQLLVASRFQLDTARMRVDAPVALTLAGVDDLLQQALEYTRTLTVELCPPVLHQRGLVPALSWLGEHFRERYKLHVDVEAVGADPHDLPEDTRMLLFQATRELLFNIVKHAKTDRASILAEIDDDRVTVIVEDRGVGYRPGALPRKATGGFGLMSIHERLECLGGVLVTESRPGEGTCSTLRLPRHRTPVAAEAKAAGDTIIPGSRGVAEG